MKNQTKLIEALQSRASERSIRMKELQRRHAQKLLNEESRRSISIQNSSPQSRASQQEKDTLTCRELAREKWRLACLHSNVSVLKRILKEWRRDLERWKIQLKKVREE